MKPKLKRKNARLKKEKKRKMIQEAFQGNLSKEELVGRRDAAAYKVVTLLRQAEPLTQQLEQIKRDQYETQREMQAYEAALSNYERREQANIVAAGEETGAEPVEQTTEQDSDEAASAEADTKVVSLKSRRKKAGH